MTDIKRRDFLKWTGAAGVAAGIGGLAAPAIAGKGGGHVIVIGGGFGGAIAAKYIRKADPSVKVTLVEQHKMYVSCPFSNKVIAGMMEMKELTFSYEGLRKNHGINLYHGKVAGVDAKKKTITFEGGKKLSYDRLVVSPGVDFRWDAIEGYDAKVAEDIPHAWKAGSQTMTLRKQLESMKDGGLVVIAAPPNPFRCPPGPYERAALMAHYLKNNKPRSKILVLDSKDKFSKQGLFKEGWKQLYGDMIEWKGAADDGKVMGVDAKNRVANTEFEEHKADVLNIIPPQKAGALAHIAGLADDSGWCPVDQKTFKSKLVDNVYVVGDSCIAGKMPKSGYAANTQAKVCAAAVVADLRGSDFGVPAYTNTCYSVLAPDYGISVAAVYKLGEDGKIAGVKGAGGLSPMAAPPLTRQQEVLWAKGWFNAITSDMFM